MDDQHADELRVLRERAYGPSADIHDDPVALARLRELEQASAAQAEERDADRALNVAPEAHTAPVAASDSLVQPDDAAAEQTAEPAGDAHQPGPAQVVSRARPSRRTVWLSAAALVVAMIVGAGITLAVASTHPGHVAVLAEAPDAEWPTDFFGPSRPGARVFEDFLGLAVVMVPNAWASTADGPECLFVLAVEQQTPENQTIISTGCAGGGFDAVASFATTRRMPEELLERFPVGTALQFVLDGSQVFVFAKTPVVPSPGSAA